MSTRTDTASGVGDPVAQDVGLDEHPDGVADGGDRPVTRHRIAHEHDAVDDDIVWLVISRHARELRATIERLLDAQDGTPRPHDPT